jgi:WD40 repeat protein
LTQVRIWDVKEYKEMAVFDRNVHQAPITSLAWHPSGSMLATGTSSREQQHHIMSSKAS